MAPGMSSIFSAIHEKTVLPAAIGCRKRVGQTVTILLLAAGAAELFGLC